MCEPELRKDEALVKPKRVQMTRQRPWRAEHPDAVIVDRRTKWGNPFTITSCIENGFAHTESQARLVCVEAFRGCLTLGRSSQWWPEARAGQFDAIADHIHDLAGHDLACWCKPGDPCHADVLLDLANREAP